MRPIPPKLRNELSEDPFMKKCIWVGCSGKPEWEHAFLYAGKQINEKWAIVPVCTFHHRGSGLDKDFNRYVAITRATDKDFQKYPRKNWEQLKQYLYKKYGKEHPREYREERYQAVS